MNIIKGLGDEIRSLTDRNRVIFTTVATTSYLPQAMVMAKFVKKQMPGCKVIVCLVEERIPDAAKNLDTCFDEVVLAKKLGFSDFYRFIFQYNQFEGANACKAQLLIHLLKTHQNHDCFIFLDSDTKVFGQFDELILYLNANQIVFFPHFIRFNYDYYNEAGILIHKYGPHAFHTNSQEVFRYLSVE